MLVKQDGHAYLGFRKITSGTRERGSAAESTSLHT